MLLHITTPIFSFRKVALSTTLFLVILILFPSLILAQGEPKSLDTGWQYRWGDSPYTAEDIPEWTVKKTEQDKKWNDISFPSNPPKREGTYGHAVGDEVIIAVVDCIRKVCRETDLPARFGGEEFVILLEEADENEALMIAERLRQTISTIRIPDVDKKITASIGISILEENSGVTGMIVS